MHWCTKKTNEHEALLHDAVLKGLTALSSSDLLQGGGVRPIKLFKVISEAVHVTALERALPLTL